jgi:hypothetical protein
MGERVVTRAFAMDRVKSEDAKKVDLGEAVKTAAAVIGRSKTLMQSARDVTKLLRFAVGASEGKPWSLHLAPSYAAVLWEAPPDWNLRNNRVISLIRLSSIESIAVSSAHTSSVRPMRPAFARNFASTASEVGGRRDPPKTSST